MVDTPTMRVVDERTSVFIELRERGAEGVIALNEPGGFQAVARPRGRPSRHSYNAFAQNFGYNPRAINVWNGVEINTYVEMFFLKESGLNVKPCKLKNVATPYYVINKKPHAQQDVFMTMEGYSVVTDLARRQTFTRQIYDLAQETRNPMYLLSALECLKVLFFQMARNGKIPLETAEKSYDKYDKIAARLFRGQTQAEQLTSFNLAFQLLAKTTGVQTHA